MHKYPNPNDLFPTNHKTICYIKNVVTAPNISIGDYTYYDDDTNPADFEKNNILFNWPEFGDKLIIGKFCAFATNVKFIMGPANHRITSLSTYPFAVFGEAWAKDIPAHLEQLPRKGDIVVGNDVWIGRESIVMPGVKIGDGAIIAAFSVVVKDVLPYTIVGGNPATYIKTRFDDELISLLSKLQWWNFNQKALAAFIPILCNPDLETVKIKIRALLS